MLLNTLYNFALLSVNQVDRCDHCSGNLSAVSGSTNKLSEEPHAKPRSRKGINFLGVFATLREQSNNLTATCSRTRGAIYCFYLP